MRKKLSGVIILLAIFISILAFAKKAEAADLNVRCRDDESRCSSEPSGTPLFNETNLAPGQIVTKTITARNEKSGVCDLKLTVSSENANTDFAKNIYVAITSERGDEFGVSLDGTVTNAKNFFNLVSESPIDFGSIDPYNTKNFSWKAKFSENALNELQGKATTFNIGLNFECDEPASENGGDGSSSGSNPQRTVSGKTTKKTVPSPTPTPTPSVLGNLVSKLRGTNNSGTTATPVATVYPTASPSPEVAGESTVSSTNNFSSSFIGQLLKKWSWLVLLLLFLIFLFFIWKRRKDDEEEKPKT